MSIKQDSKNREINKKKALFIISLIAANIIENSLISDVPFLNIIYTNWILLINSSLAAVLSIILVINIVLEQKFLDYYLKIHIALAIVFFL